MKVSDLETGDVFSVPSLPSRLYIKGELGALHFAAHRFSSYTEDDTVEEVVGHIDPEEFDKKLREVLGA